MAKRIYKGRQEAYDLPIVGQEITSQERTILQQASTKTWSSATGGRQDASGNGETLVAGGTVQGEERVILSAVLPELETMAD